MSVERLRGLVLPLVAILLVAVASLAPSGSGNEPARSPSTADVTQSAYACPAGSVITVAAGQVVPGTSATASVLPDRTTDPVLGDPTTWRTDVVDARGVIVDQAGRGSGAVGFFAGTAPKSGGGGLVVGSCAAVVDDAWMLGLGSGNKHFSTLILTNLAASPAAVDVSLWGPEGEIDAVNTAGIVIEPFSVRRIRLDELAAGESELAIHVERRRGSVSAVVNDTSTSTFLGTEPISATQTPRRSQVIGGVIGTTKGRTLLILNPGSSTARVALEVLGPDGTFVPSDLEQVTVPPGTVQSISVPASAGGDDQALRLTSDQPVAATVRMAPTSEDFAYAEATPVLDGPAVVPVDLGAQQSMPVLVLTAPDAAASVEIQAFDAAMAPLDTQTVTVEAGATTTVRPGAKGAAYLVLRPTGDVVAAATYAKGDGVSSLALRAAPVTVQAPQVRPVD